MNEVSALAADLSIRAVTDADAGVIADIYNYYVAHTVITFEEEPVPVQEMAARVIEVRGHELPWLVAERDGEVLGYSHASRWKARSAYRFAVETSVYLKHGMQGQGIGRALYGGLLPFLRARGVHAVIGGAALPNAASVALHEKLGFQHVGTFRQVGFKQQRWVDVAYWQLILAPGSA